MYNYTIQGASIFFMIVNSLVTIWSELLTIMVAVPYLPGKSRRSSITLAASE
jgi:hypothetical protein